MGKVRKSCSFFLLALLVLGLLIQISRQSSWYERLNLKDFPYILNTSLKAAIQDGNFKMQTDQGSAFSNTSIRKAISSVFKAKSKHRPSFHTTLKRRVNMRVTLTNVIKNLPKFNDSFRSPCWYDQYKNVTTLRCFPYFYLAGFPKCGTTDLFHKIAAHPLVIAGISKGTHYFTRSYFNHTLKPCTSTFDCATVTFSRTYYARAAQMMSLTSDTKAMNTTFLEIGKTNRPTFQQVAFIEAFPRESLDIWKEGQKFKKFPGIIADGSPSTSWDHHNFRLIKENQGYGYPRNFSADWIRHIYPDTKIIMILRNPVTRIFSDYLMYTSFMKKRLPDVKNFHARVQVTMRKLEQCLERETTQFLCTTYNYNLRLHPGIYYFYIRAWLEKFPREQMLFLKFEEFVANTPETLAKVFKFLGLPAVSKEGREFMSKAKVLHGAKFKGYKMLNETEILLANFYKPFNEKLAKLLGEDRFLWN